MALSERQQNILGFLREFIIENGYPPTIREIGRAANITSTSVVNYNLDVLQRLGHIYRDRTISRGIRLVQEETEAIDVANFISIPLLGRIAAGNPIPVPEGSYDRDTDVIQLTRDLVPEYKNLYALRVKGQSMIDALINDGDVVVMRHVNTAENGDMVAAWLVDQEETTLKRFFHEGNQIRLQPENKTMQPIYVSSNKVEIQGRVVAVIRQIH
ncbi:transcriptional repressor LexA [Anaerolineales bacterium HSG6]|nr:transcriptional repressor LexA [Anaerolineales bacterium HSG6]MDM8530093.1 transcriptional repressor LexA [Anaerolineales bacterium HSG25]